MAERDQQMDAFALLVADVYDAAGVLRRLGEQTAATEGQTQARWQVLSVISDGDWTVPMARRPPADEPPGCSAHSERTGR